MLIETGRVVAVEEGYLWIETVRQSVCGTCAAQKGCGHGLLNQVSDGRRSYLQVSSRDHPRGAFSIDDQVRIGIPESTVLRGSTILYLLPLAAMLAGAVFGAQLPGAGDLEPSLGALAGFVAGFGAVRLHALGASKNPALQPRLLGQAPVSGE